MLCFICENISFNAICKKCQSLYLKTNLKKRQITKEVPLYSFYNYEEIQELILLKYKIVGSRIYKTLAKNSFKIFANNFTYPNKVYSIAIDDKITKGYSHTAILSNSLKSPNIIPINNTLTSQNNIKYAKKNLEFRLQNPRNFQYKGKKNIDVILVDDIVVSGSTMKEAIMILEVNKVNVLFAIALCDNYK